MIKIAKEIATIAHKDQIDKAGKPYVKHLEAVASKVIGTEEKTVAWLHDIFEDTDFSYEQLSVFFPISIVEAVEALTKRKGESYEDYLKRIAENPLAIKVKMADLEHNTDLTRFDSPTETDKTRVQKYVERRNLLVELVKSKGSGGMGSNET
jgi:(p)ppGpp synthase/HD superfamily hydrolase